MRQLLVYDAIAYGMGMGEDEEVAKGAAWLITNYEGRLVLDADALNSLARYGQEGLLALFRAKKCDVLLTPHAKEFSRLFGLSVEELSTSCLSATKENSSWYGVNILLKNAVSVAIIGNDLPTRESSELLEILKDEVQKRRAGEEKLFKTRRIRVSDGKP